MALPSASMPTDVNAEQPNVSGSRLHGYWLVLARMVWLALLVLSLSVFVAGLPTYFAWLHELCASCSTGQLDVESAQLLQNLGFSIGDYAVFNLVLNVALALVWFAVGGLIFWRKSTDSMVLLVASALVLFAGSSGARYAVVYVLVGTNAAWLFPVSLSQFFAHVACVLVLFLFPSGRLAPRWMGLFVVAWLVFAVDYDLLPDVIAQSPLFVWNWPALLSWLVLLIFCSSFAFSQLYRYRRVSSPLQRQQTKWVVFAFTIVLLGLIGENLALELLPRISPFRPPVPLYQLAYSLVWTIAPILVPLSFGIAILYSRLWDIDIIINRSLVYGVLTVSIVALYVLVVVGLGTIFQAQGNLGIALLATGLIAVLFQPLRSRLQRAVNRLMYGERDEPYAVLSRLGQRLEATLAPDAVLSTMVEMVAQALKLPYAAITLKQDQAFPIAASYGRAVDTLLILSLVYQAETIGQLMLAPRSKGEPFTPADRRLLDDLARQASVAAHAVRLTADLQRSRERLVTTREEERRRLRRDLHDGLGPTLAALNLQAGVVRTLIKNDPTAADELVTEWRTELRAAIADIRRLVYELRPPALDELGLVGAIRERAAQYSTHAETNALQTMVEAPDALPPLPAAVEVATYRIAQEALANIVHHAQARTCSIRLWMDEMLHLEITDDGIGLPAEHHAGVGLISMRERAAELGGTCSIEAVVTGGTRICAQLPFPKE